MKAYVQKGRAIKAEAQAARQAAEAGQVGQSLGHLKKLEALGPRSGLGRMIDGARRGRALRFVSASLGKQGEAAIRDGVLPHAEESWRGLREIKSLGAGEKGPLAALNRWRNDRRILRFERELTIIAARQPQPGFIGLARRMRAADGHRPSLRERWAERRLASRVTRAYAAMAGAPGKHTAESVRAHLGLMEELAVESGRPLAAAQRSAMQKTYARALTAEVGGQPCGPDNPARHPGRELDAGARGFASRGGR